MSPKSRKVLSSYFYTAVFCVAIAVLLWYLIPQQDFVPTLWVSLAIGLSICSMFVWFGDVLSTRFSPYITTIPLTAAGLFIGLLIGGTIVAKQPLMFFTQDWQGLVLALFFGVVGILIFATKGRLADVRAELAESYAAQQGQERQLLETELRLLQAQIEPHFLFNTLSNIVSMIHTHPHDAEDTLVNLTTLLRASLKRTRQRTCSLGDELEMTSAYLQVGKIRMQERLDYSINVPAALRDRQLPPLLLQPLVENALVHGLEPKETGGRIDVEVKPLPNARMCLQVCDDGVGIQVNNASQGTGLRNVRERLYGLYGDDASLRIEERSPVGVCATIELPMHLSEPEK